MIQRLQCIVLFFVSFHLLGQEGLNLATLNEITVGVNKQNEVIYVHELKKGETLYSLSRYFKVSVNDLLIYNNLNLDEPIPLGARIIIPLDINDIWKSIKPKESWIPVYYQVKRKETLFKISNSYFNQRIQDMVARNAIEKLSLSINQKLIVGWWGLAFEEPRVIETINQIENQDSLRLKPEIELPIDSSIIATELISNDSIQLIKPIKLHSTKGIALWDKSETESSALIALHKTAKVGSIIKLQHPVTELIVVAKVVGKIPADVYPDDVDIILSASVASKLGALNSRFRIFMSYYE